MDVSKLKTNFAVFVPGDKVIVVDGYWKGVTTRVTTKADDADYPRSWACFAYWIYTGGGYAVVPASHLRLA